METENSDTVDKKASIDNGKGENDKETTVQRLKEFCYYLTESIEKNLNFCLIILEDRIIGKKTNSDVVTAVGAIATPIPYLGRGISSALKEGEIFILNKIDKKNSKCVADLVYYVNDNQEAMRQMLIDSSIEIFYCFEDQFLKLTCEGGPRRAMHKLAKDASNRIFGYFLKNKQGKDINRDDFSKGLLFGDSIKNKFGVKSGKTVQKGEEEEWKTSSIYRKVGLYLEDTNEFFGNDETKSSKYGYRRVFGWENQEEIRKKWSLETCAFPSNYHLKKEELPGIFSEVREYIIRKNAVEEAKLDRDKKHEELMDNHQEKHEELMLTFMEKFNDVLEDLAKNYEEIKIGHQQNENIVTVIKEQEIKDEERHKELNSKLSEIHVDVIEAKQGQVVLKETTEKISEEICTIRTKQDEFSNSTDEIKQAIQQVSQQKTVTLSDIVKDNYEVKKVTRIVNEVKESITDRNLESKVKKEVQRTFKKLFK